MSFFAQHQLESLNVENTLIDELKEQGSAKTETELRGVLGCFLFSSDDVFKKIKVLSGGEKSRVALAKTLISESNFLLLDEPTNHLDIQSVNILMQALNQYEGSYVVISHDRHFIKEVANKIWYIEDHQLKEYPGTYDEYHYWRDQKLKNEREGKKVEAPIKKQVEKPVIKAVSNPVSEDLKRQVKNAQSQLDKIEESIGKLEKEKKSLEIELSKPSVYGDVNLLAETTVKYDKVKSTLDKEQEQWDQLAEKIESLMQQS